MVADIGPAGKGALQCIGIRVILPKPEIADDRFGLHPPLAGFIDRAVGLALIQHRSVGLDPFVTGTAQGKGERPDPAYHVEIARGEGTFQQQPGGLDVVAVGNGTRQDRPVPPEIELQVPVRAHHLLADEVKQLHQRGLEPGIGPDPIEIGIGLQDMEMRIHGLVGIDIVGREGHVFQGREIPGKRLDVAAAEPVGEMGLHRFEKCDSGLQHRLVMAHLIQFAEPVDGKALGIELLFAVEGDSVGRNAPVHTAVIRIAEIRQEPILGRRGGLQVFRFPESPVSGGKGPDDTGIEDHAPRRIRRDPAIGRNFAVEAAPGIPQFQPPVQDIVFQDPGRFLEEDFRSVIHRLFTDSVHPRLSSPCSSPVRPDRRRRCGIPPPRDASGRQRRQRPARWPAGQT